MQSLECLSLLLINWDILLWLLRGSNTTHWKNNIYDCVLLYCNNEISHYVHYTLFWYKSLKNIFYNYAHYAHYAQLILNCEIIPRSLHYFRSLLLNWDTALCLLRCLNTSHRKIISLKQIIENNIWNTPTALF